MYRRINTARSQNPALRSTKRFFLNKQEGRRLNDEIFSAAKWAEDNVVLVFINLRDKRVGPETFAVPRNLPLRSDSGVRYQVRNLIGMTRLHPCGLNLERRKISLRMACA